MPLDQEIGEVVAGRDLLGILTQKGEAAEQSIDTEQVEYSMENEVACQVDAIIQCQLHLEPLLQLGNVEQVDNVPPGFEVIGVFNVVGRGYFSVVPGNSGPVTRRSLLSLVPDQIFTPSASSMTPGTNPNSILFNLGQDLQLSDDSSDEDVQERAPISRSNSATPSGSNSEESS